MKTTDVIFRKDLYPRFTPDQNLIERYAASIDLLPPIKVNQDNILIDGFHRWKAHELREVDMIDAEVITTKSEAEIEVLAYRLNSQHGAQLTSKEKQVFAQKKVGILTVEDIAEILSVSESSVTKWTQTQRKVLKGERDRRIIEEYLRAWNTQEKVGELMELPQQTVADVIKHLTENSKITEIGKGFEPFIYTTWNVKEAGKETTHFGHFPEVFMENLLVRHTEPLDIVYDPFAGSGTTVDVCQKWRRRYYCSDRKVTPGREFDIRQWDINEGIPEDLPRPALVFLDPPYWKQAEGEYSDDANDLGNMALEEFNLSMECLFTSLTDIKAERIAVVIQPTQYKNDFVWTDHIFDFHRMVEEEYIIEIRYMLPYSSQQYTPQCVLEAKERNTALGLSRDLVVWRKK